jgi:dolichyl-phosphate-mannose-protein mannosyltransferase
MVVHPRSASGSSPSANGSSECSLRLGWRFSVALVGTLSILIMGRIARRIFSQRRRWAASRPSCSPSRACTSSCPAPGSSTSCVAFFALPPSGRSSSTANASRMHARRDRRRAPDRRAACGLRAWLGAAPLAMDGRPHARPVHLGTKWSGIFVLAAFGVMSVWWDMGARRAAGIRPWGRAAILKDGPYAALAMVGTTIVVTYVASVDRVVRHQRLAITGSGTPSTPAKGCSGCRRCCVTS